MNLFRLANLGLLVLVVVSVLSCSKDDDDNPIPQNAAPTIQLVKPVGTVVSSNGTVSIEVELLFTDDSGLQRAEIRLGSTSGPAGVYDVSQRGLSGTADGLRYSVEVPEVLGIQGTNYIYVVCTDVNGNTTILDEEFEVKYEDNEPPFLIITEFREGDASSITGDGYVYLSYSFSDNEAVERVTIDIYIQSWSWIDPPILVATVEQIYDPALAEKDELLLPLRPSGGWTAGYEEVRVDVKAFDQNGNSSEEISAFTVIEF